MYMLNEGTDVWCQVNAIPLGHDIFEILGPVEPYDLWEFAPGSRVICRPLGHKPNELVAAAPAPSEHGAVQPVTIYIHHLDEEPDCLRPVLADPLEEGSFKVLGPKPQEEKWAFPPGSVVRCERTRFPGGGEGLVATASA